MKHGSLRVQITLAVGMIVTLACLILTVNSIYSANSYYVPYLADEAIPDSTVSNQTEHFDENTMKPDTPEDLSRGFLVRGLGVMAGAIITSHCQNRREQRKSGSLRNLLMECWEG